MFPEACKQLGAGKEFALVLTVNEGARRKRLPLNSKARGMPNAEDDKRLVTITFHVCFSPPFVLNSIQNN